MNPKEASNHTLSRRQFIGVAGASIPFLAMTGVERVQPALKSDPVICVFSKNLQWLSVAEMADVVPSLGFHGVDLTVRKGGHVELASVATELPKAVGLLRKAGLQVPMIVTDIVDPDDPGTEQLIKTASQLGIQNYRMGALKYDPQLGVAKTLDSYKIRFQKLAQINKKYNIHGCYQNHCGASYVGSALWDLWELLKEVDPKWMGCQYDIKHAVTEGGLNWPNGLDLLQSYVHCMDIKDFMWVKKDGKWQQQQVPLGEGMVDFKAYLAQLKKQGTSGPFSIHFEYPLGGADVGKKQITISKEEVLGAMKRDVATFKTLLANS